jgi:aldehyde dehydrogenase (NAD+)
LFLLNGWGCNPIVAGPAADLGIVVGKSVEAKLFNSGQDCVAPDVIPVRQDIAKQFGDMLKDHLSGVKAGDYRDHDVKVGKVVEQSRLSHLSVLLLKHHCEIVCGGCVDYQKEYRLSNNYSLVAMRQDKLSTVLLANLLRDRFRK